MRTRLSKSERRDEILKKARQIVVEQGLAKTEMEDIRLACGISRGGLYHHFSNKRAVLDALVREEVGGLADALNDKEASPILVLLLNGSSHLGGDAGVVSALQTLEDKLDYLFALEQAFSVVLKDALLARMTNFVRDDINVEHVVELFLTINALINRREVIPWDIGQALKLPVLLPLRWRLWHLC
ncbi:TetR/AcrR family transcriptional regulator [Rhodobacteraceae bacterium D3-12]|nr:TetR/AcrR family transcriptional regulator [Rhodobacteraceae bacterium D3-12]